MLQFTHLYLGLNCNVMFSINQEKIASKKKKGTKIFVSSCYESLPLWKGKGWVYFCNFNTNFSEFGWKCNIAKGGIVVYPVNNILKFESYGSMYLLEDLMSNNKICRWHLKSCQRVKKKTISYGYWVCLHIIIWPPTRNPKCNIEIIIIYMLVNKQH